MTLVNLEHDDEQELVTVDGPLDLASAEINQQISTAKRFPRSLTRFRKALIANATLTKEIAGACIYALPRGGKKLEGPSIRFAEMALSAYGNCRAGGRVVAELDNLVVAQGVFHDLETNAAITLETSRRIIDSKGIRFGVDMIVVTGNAARAIAMRNAILTGIPKAIWWDAYLAARHTIVGDFKALADKRKAAMEAFKPYGIVDQQIFAALGVEGIADVAPDHLVTLAGFLTAIQQEERDPEEIFPPATSRAAPKPPAEKKEAAPAAKAAPPPPPTAPKATDDGEPTELEMSVANMIADARSLDDLDALPRLFQLELSEASEPERVRVLKQIDDAKKART